MAARRCGDVDGRPSWGLEPRARPWLETAGVAAEPLCTGDGGDDGARRWQQRPAGGVEVVVVVVVAEQHRVDRSEIGRGYGRTGQLARPRAPAEAIRPTGRVERRIGQQPPACDLDQDRGTADVGDA